MYEDGDKSISDLKGEALQRFNMTPEFAKKRQNKLGEAYKNAQVCRSKCIGCSRCEDVCFYGGVKVEDRKAVKGSDCIGCGYCFQVCPTKALYVDKKGILKSAFQED